MNEKNVKSFPIWKVLYKRLIIIILATILGFIGGVVFAKLFAKPTYKASQSVVLRLVLSDNGSNKESANGELAQKYLPTVVKYVSSPLVIAKAQEKYGDSSSISSGSVSVSYGEKSIIFRISYSDKTAKMAKEKLIAVVDSVNEVLLDLVEAEDASLVNVQNEPTITSSDKSKTYMVIGAGVGLIASVCIVLLVYAFDNTIRSKEEFEESTGLSVLAMLDK